MTRYLKDSSFSSRFNFPTTSVLDSKRIFEKIPIRSSKISGTREIIFNRRADSQDKETESNAKKL